MQLKRPENINISPFEDSSFKKPLKLDIIMGFKNLVKKITSFYSAKQKGFQRRKRIRLLKRELRKGVLNLDTLFLSNIGIINVEFLILFLENKTLKEIAEILDHDTATIESYSKSLNRTLNVYFPELSIQDLRKLIHKNFNKSISTKTLKRQDAKEVKASGKINLNAINIT